MPTSFVHVSDGTHLEYRASVTSRPALPEILAVCHSKSADLFLVHELFVYKGLEGQMNGKAVR